MSIMKVLYGSALSIKTEVEDKWLAQESALWKNKNAWAIFGFSGQKLDYGDLFGLNVLPHIVYMRT